MRKLFVIGLWLGSLACWQGCGWSNDPVMEVSPVVTYTASDLKVGDYYYEDGTWSDGGLRSVDGMGNMEFADERPAPDTSRRVIGIVFQTDTNRIGESEKKYLKTLGVENVHGLVVSARNLNSSVAVSWGNVWKKKDYLCPSWSDMYQDISGLSNMQRYEEGGHISDDHVAALLLRKINMEDTLGRLKRTPWFIPSAGQWWDIFVNLGGVRVLEESRYVDASQRGCLFLHGCDSVGSSLNRWLSLIPEDDRDMFGDFKDCFWSSSRYNKENQWYVAFIGKGGFLMMDADYCWHKYKLRGVFAF